ncbi:hypothetical protein PAHAL_5G254800 [Panicum hallii]|uniref:Uncharacterized protein n=1 Tax=Panicum hallii TaxID=206008 RepID=A0A2T8IL73_9POAL|nr:hypothetical protein PAHAL_5G254800 [Panicum hallii]
MAVCGGRMWRMCHHQFQRRSSCPVNCGLCASSSPLLVPILLGGRSDGGTVERSSYKERCREYNGHNVAGKYVARWWH